MPVLLARKYYFPHARLIGLLLLLCSMGISCAAGEALNRWPESHIDRPLTQPKGLLSTTSGVAASYNAETEEAFAVPLPPIVWTWAVTDDFNIAWVAILPMALKYQALNTDSHKLAFTFGSGYGYSSVESYIVEPTLWADYRWKLSSKVALLGMVGAEGRASSIYPLELQEIWGVVGALYQATPVIALEAGVGHARELIWTQQDGGEWDSRVPYFFGARWSVDPQWETQFKYAYGSRGALVHGEAHNLSIFLLHYW